MSYIYIVSEGTGPAVPIKIGHSQDPKERMHRQLQIGNPRKLYVKAFMSGTVQQEQAMHRHLRTNRAEGNEWYWPTPEIINLIYWVENEGGYITPERLIQAIVSGRFLRDA